MLWNRYRGQSRVKHISSPVDKLSIEALKTFSNSISAIISWKLGIGLPIKSKKHTGLWSARLFGHKPWACTCVSRSILVNRPGDRYLVCRRPSRADNYKR